MGLGNPQIVLRKTYIHVLGEYAIQLPAACTIQGLLRLRY